MTDKERFDALMKLSDFWMDRWKKRSQNEYAISVGLWAILAAAIIYVKQRPPEFVLAGFLIATVVGYAILWARPVYLKHEQDAHWYFYYKELAESIVRPHVKVRDVNPSVPSNFFLAYSPQFQVCTTIFLAICAYLLIGKGACG